VYYTYFFQYGPLGNIIAGLFPLFGAYRLARFNISSTKTNLNYFKGVPITAAGGILALLTLFGGRIPLIVITVVFTALCFLMISRIRIPSLKEVPLPKYGTIATVFIGVLIYFTIRGTYGQFPYLIYVAVPIYVTYVAYVAYRFIRRKNKKEVE
jgi:CDP-diacylglycerol--serine O-phosphatidyltransferase